MTTWLAVLYWVALFLFTGASLTLAILAWSAKSHWLIGGSAATLLAAIIVASLPGPGTTPILSVLLSLAGVTLAVIGGGPAATTSLRLATRGSVPNGVHGGILVESEPREVLRGGLAIGLLERLAVASTVIAGLPAALAVIVAVKGVGRFTELDAAEARERFIIGSFVSLIWASASAAVVVLALT
jgi:hypothetical protein